MGELTLQNPQLLPDLQELKRKCAPKPPPVSPLWELEGVSQGERFGGGLDFLASRALRNGFKVKATKKISQEAVQVALAGCGLQRITPDGLRLAQNREGRFLFELERELAKNDEKPDDFTVRAITSTLAFRDSYSMPKSWPRDRIMRRLVDKFQYASRSGRQATAVRYAQKILDHLSLHQQIVGGDIRLDQPNPLTGRMRIEQLEPKVPASRRCENTAWTNRDYGWHLNSSRLGCLPGDPNIFAHRTLEPDRTGSVLIDGSGSMQLSEDDMRMMTMMAPGVWIAYYQGTSDSSGAGGVLAVVADKGRVLSRNAELPHFGGGNSVDFEALLELLRHPQPRIYVGDLQFCGGKPGQAEAAHALFEACQRDGRIRYHVEGLEGAVQLFKKLRHSR